MPIKYAEITIIINLEKESMINYFYKLLGNENKTNDNDTIIILFDDETIYDVKKECTNTKIHKLMEIGPNCLREMPYYFDLKNETFFYKRSIYINGEERLNLKPIFANNKKYITTKKEPSVFNSIYFLYNTDVLAIVKIKSNEEKPRFLLAYDDEYFEKDNIIYFVNYIFSKNNNI
jgi:hypothetical protein